MERKILVVLLWFVMLFSGIIFSILFVSSGIVFMSSKNIKKYKDNSYAKYYVSHFNKISNETTFGFANFPSKIFKNKEFITFRSNEVFSVISSKFTNNEFECSGTCLCNDKVISYNRRTTNILSKSFYFVISALSLSFAVRIATTYFSEECLNSLRNICSEENIESEINFCESKFGIEGGKEYSSITEELGPKASIKEKSDENENEIEEKKDEYEGMEREYHCEGYCVSNGGLRREESKYESEKFECENYKTEAKITIIETGKLGFLRYERLKGSMRARTQFGKEYLSPYCRAVSNFKYEYVYTTPKGKRVLRKSTVNLCVGTNDQLNPFGNISCNLLDRFSTQDGVRERQRIGKAMGV